MLLSRFCVQWENSTQVRFGRQSLNQWYEFDLLSKTSIHVNGVLNNLWFETPSLGCPIPAVCHHFLGEELAIRWRTLQVYGHVLFPGSHHSSGSRSLQEGASPTMPHPLIACCMWIGLSWLWHHLIRAMTLPGYVFELFRWDLPHKKFIPVTNCSKLTKLSDDFGRMSSY